MIDEVFFDGVRYVSANDAALSAGLTRDYVTKMCRLGKFDGRHVGKIGMWSIHRFRTF